ncbi:hypothetical protein Ssi03_62690 [Sphaerisporangium siamense]|uniref:Uncharacterized protein n=1 Tax=Sphaerisporangium siamense TaxID=795645 RepID=A0A7W7GAP3_9ACTN|nr:hypothetical protein [Sphaerisporangium siamense]MBB4702577.1 hypothetical protein [Sphaerisporangium siamense]GII88279.1 hypothetical protein Ssi03_62690 [Sphaerisporangium siamense]
MDPISSLSKEYIYSFVEGVAGTETVEVACVQTAEPTSGDWKPAGWANVTPAGADARILIGPGTTLALADGTYQMWVRVTGTTEQPVMYAGPVVIT